jgi:hypothetical protein
MRRCWECEVEAVPIVEAILPLPEGDGPVIDLCPACFESVYLALVSSPGGFGAVSPGGGAQVAHVLRFGV